MRPSELAERVGAWYEPALLESTGGASNTGGRWSFYAAEPRVVFESIGDSWTIQRGRWSRGGGHSSLDALRQLIREFHLAEIENALEPGAPPFQGGLIGYIGYDVAPLIERLPRKSPIDSRLPDARFGLYDTAIAVDHLAQRATLTAYDLLGEGQRATRNRLERWRSRLNSRVVLPDQSRINSPIAANMTHAAFVDAVERTLEYIRAGDIFQANVSQRFEARGTIEPLDLFLRLRRRSPAPFAAFLRWGEFAVVSSSPESFYGVSGDRIVTRPIKGTRPRGATEDEDDRLVRELRASPKDRAELTMIVDLERNDLGRVCEYGSVRVSDPLAVESFAQVHHLVATVEGRLRQDADAIDIVRALFPGGSISGAPKIRAMEIIDELEPTRRGVYTGAIGYFGAGGSTAFNIAIRTLTVDGGVARYQVGGGIVADSDPELEYQETLHKGRGMREVLEGSGDPPPPHSNPEP